MNLPHWRGWLIAGAIFFLGIAVGGAGVTLWGARHLRQTLLSSAEAGGRADRAAARIGAQLTKELALTDAESAQVRQILSESAANLKGIRRRAALQAGAELRATTRRLAEALPPAKHAELYRVIAHRYQRLGLPPPPFEPETTP